jgi:hypothetical protein
MKTLNAAAFLAAALTLAPTVSRANGYGPTYSPPVPVHAAAPVAVPTTTVAYGGRDRDGRWDREREERERRERMEARRNEWSREQWAQFDARESRERAEFMSRWGWNGYRVAEFDRHQAHEREEFRDRLSHELREREQRQAWD